MAGTTAAAAAATAAATEADARPASDCARCGSVVDMFTPIWANLRDSRLSIVELSKVELSKVGLSTAG